MKGMNQFGWNELLSTNIEKDKAFYKAVLGWEAEDRKFGDIMYTLFKSSGVEVAGMMEAAKDFALEQSCWLSYVTVADVDESIKKAVNAGGKVVVEKMKIENVGDIAIIIDATGASIGLCNLQE